MKGFGIDVFFQLNIDWFVILKISRESEDMPFMNVLYVLKAFDSTWNMNPMISPALTRNREFMPFMAVNL